MRNLIKTLREDSHRRAMKHAYIRAYNAVSIKDAVITDGMRQAIKRADKAISEEIAHLCECFELELWEAHSVFDTMKFKTK